MSRPSASPEYEKGHAYAQPKKSLLGRTGMKNNNIVKDKRVVVPGASR
ncbi:MULTISPECIES: hypothetical protein [Citrobacter freundii complex]|nr:MULTISPECIES: hypothetical protein [Citrobacter freundii complex]EKV4359815.1 hypothetical protein [Citrobacter freundii]ELE2062755.1 hypothetical protein [Citrobacter freundii]ELK6675797.1 hypothetical protein [Citrobacter freundii]MBN4827919.1 hypothetical protein [Citrobacter freundii]MCR3679768.1 hypothetical protein [Citrobacter freundii]